MSRKNRINLPPEEKNNGNIEEAARSGEALPSAENMKK